MHGVKILGIAVNKNTVNKTVTLTRFHTPQGIKTDSGSGMYLPT